MDEQEYTTHILERTSPKGEAFLGRCTRCGQTDLILSQVSEECVAPPISQERALSDALSGPPIIDAYTGIRRVALEIAYDNGMIDRQQSEADWLRSLDPVMGAEGVDDADLRVLDSWCLTLTDEQVQTLAAGEDDEMKAVEALCPRPELCGLFADIFDGEPSSDPQQES